MFSAPVHERLHDVVIGDLGPARVQLVGHIGSTAVPDLAAKPVIDILLVVDDPVDDASYLPELEAAGYELRVREADFDEHRRLRPTTRDVHVHVLARWSPEIDRYLTLRDLLRTSSSARAAYEARKREPAEREWPTIDQYASAKGEVIEALIAEAGGPAPRR